MDAARTLEALDRLTHAGRHPALIDLTHREHADAKIADGLALARIQRAGAEEHHTFWLHGPRTPIEPRAEVSFAEQRSYWHAVHIATRRRGRSVDVAVRIDPQHADVAPRIEQARDRTHRDRVIAAQDQREVPQPGDLAHALAELDARGLDQIIELGARVADRAALRHRDGDIAVIGHAQAHLQQPVLEPGVADRVRPHVHTAPSGAEVHGHADDADFADLLSGWGSARLRHSCRSHVQFYGPGSPP